MYWFDRSPGMEQEWTGTAMPKLFQLTPSLARKVQPPPGIKVQNSFEELKEDDDETDDEVPMLSMEDLREAEEGDRVSLCC